jgi:hypothetical protein
MAGPRVSAAEKLDQATPAEKVGPVSAVGEVLPTDRLVQELRNLVQAFAERALLSAGKLSAGKVEGLADRLTGFAEGGGTGLIDAVTGAEKPDQGSAASSDEARSKRLGGLSRRMGRMRMADIVEAVDVGASAQVVYHQFEGFAGLGTEETLQQESGEEVVLWSGRTCEPEVVERVPEQRIVWRSHGDKGQLDGVVTFHALAPDLTRVILALEYRPQGLWRRVGSACGVQGRRTQLELKRFAYHVMARTADEGAQETAEHEEEQRDGVEEERHEGEGVPDSVVVRERPQGVGAGRPVRRRSGEEAD